MNKEPETMLKEIKASGCTSATLAFLARDCSGEISKLAINCQLCLFMCEASQVPGRLQLIWQGPQTEHVDRLRFDHGDRFLEVFGP